MMCSSTASVMCSVFRVVYGRGYFRRARPLCESILEATHHDTLLYRSYSSEASKSTEQEGKVRDPAPFFFHKEIQEHLMKLNLKDTSKVFQQKKLGQKLTEPVMKYLTEEELEQQYESANQRAKYFLQCPPILLPRKEINEVLSKDPELQGHDESKFIFTDISYGVPHHERLIVVRDPDGTLRKAYWSERQRMDQIYFPVDGRSVFIPRLFEPENVQSLLDRSEFEFLLDKACVQFEPDDPDFTRVTSVAYEFIDNHQKYDSLQGTRHFASLVFYLSFHSKIDNILLHCISKYCIDDAVTIIKIFYIINSLQMEEDQSQKDTDFILGYIKNHAVKKSELSKMLQAYVELNLKEIETQSQEM